MKPIDVLARIDRRNHRPLVDLRRHRMLEQDASHLRIAIESIAAKVVESSRLTATRRRNGANAFGSGPATRSLAKEIVTPSRTLWAAARLVAGVMRLRVPSSSCAPQRLIDATGGYGLFSGSYCLDLRRRFIGG